MGRLRCDHPETVYLFRNQFKSQSICYKIITVCPLSVNNATVMDRIGDSKHGGYRILKWIPKGPM